MESETLKEISKVYIKASEEAEKQFGEETVREGEFTFVQPYKDGQAIIVSVEIDDDGERKVNTDVTDTMIVGKPISRYLDIFKRGGEDDE